METIRKWFYRPKKDDTSLLAQFFFADEGLNLIAGELDSFDGRKDPERCTTLVNQLRQAQDKVLTITNSIMDVLIGDDRANRDFRAKFPEDVLQENLAGQLWFGAECLAAGSSIMNRESESTEMRPLAKALTKSLEQVRNYLREACLRSNNPNGPLKLNNNELVTEMLLESLKIFDRLFAAFELRYVSAMVPVKTPQEHELQELIGVLFSETLQRALKMKLLTQEMVDNCDPALMFTIPRLAIVSGLLVFPNGPLCIDKPVEEMSEMFRPFRTLLVRIHELLWTLDKCELYNLEKILCDNNDEHKLSEDFVLRFYSNCPNKDTGYFPPERYEVETTVYEDDYGSHSPSTSGYLIPNTVQHDTIVASISSKEALVRAESLPDHDSLQVISDAAATLTSILNTKDAGKKSLQSPDDSGICTENTSLDRSPSLELNRCECTRFCKCQPEIPTTSKDSKRVVRKVKKVHTEEDASSVASSDTTSSYNSECADEDEIAMAMQAAKYANKNEVRAKYKSSEDLIHRLYVCIAGVADQLQTNFASDLRNILKSVFLMNVSDSEPSITETVQSIEYHPAENEVIENEFSSDPNILAQEALFDSNVYFHLNGGNHELAYENHPRHNEEDRMDVLTGEDLSGQIQVLAEEELPATVQGAEGPPIWIPDVQAPKCMSCEANFTVVKRRHHCRNCGKVFCAKCSSNSVPLPKFGHIKPVRVCNRCFMYHLAPFKM